MEQECKTVRLYGDGDSSFHLWTGNLKAPIRQNEPKAAVKPKYK